MVNYTVSWLPLPQEEFQIIQGSLVQYAYNDFTAYLGHFLNFSGGLLAFIVNALTMVVILHSKNIRTSNSGILMFQMAFVELIRGIIGVGTGTTFFIKGQTASSVELAYLVSLVGPLTAGIWLLSLTLSAFDRYWTIVRQKTLSKVQLALLMALTWIATILFCLLPVFTTHQSYCKIRISGIYGSFSFYDHSQTGIILTIVVILYMGLPNQAISTCYSAIIKSYVAVRIQSGRFTIDDKEIKDATKLTLWQIYRLIKGMGQNKDISTLDIQSNTKLTMNMSHESNTALQLSTRQRMELLVFRKSVTSFVIFNICWLPITITTIYELIAGVQVSRFVDSFDVLCMTYSGFINAYLNFVLDERFKTGLIELLGSKK